MVLVVGAPPDIAVQQLVLGMDVAWLRSSPTAIHKTPPEITKAFCIRSGKQFLINDFHYIGGVSPERRTYFIASEDRSRLDAAGMFWVFVK